VARKDCQAYQKVREAASPILKLKNEEEEKESIQSEASDEDLQSTKGDKFKNDESPSTMLVEQLHDFIANVVKAQVGGDARKTHLYTKPYTKGG